MNDQTNGDTSEVQNRKSLLTDHDGKPSTMRLMSFIALFASIWFAWISLTDSNTTSNEGFYITTAFLLAAFAPKAFQKFVENSYPLKK